MKKINIKFRFLLSCLRIFFLFSFLLFSFSPFLLSAQDTLYLYKGGNVFYKCAINQIDSMKFTPPIMNTYMVSFDANGGSGVMAPQLFTEGVAQSLYANAFTHDSHFFENWNTQSDGNGAVYTDQQTITISANTTLYAQWTANNPCPATVTDISGNSYPTVQIGAQCWMKENLKTTMYNDGEEIPNLTDESQWRYTMNGAMCYHGNNPSNAVYYGALYNYKAVQTGLCPQGWHLPTDDEFSVLVNYLVDYGYNWDGSFYGEKVAKSLSSVEPGDKGMWTSSTTNGAPGSISYPGEAKRNASGFSANPAGSRNGLGQYFNLGLSTYYWSATMFDANNIYYLCVYYDWENLYRYYGSKECGFSVRCLKD